MGPKQENQVLVPLHVPLFKTNLRKQSPFVFTKSEAVPVHHSMQQITMQHNGLTLIVPPPPDSFISMVAIPALPCTVTGLEHWSQWMLPGPQSGLVEADTQSGPAETHSHWVRACRDTQWGGGAAETHSQGFVETHSQGPHVEADETSQHQ